ncbi:hypothetical protein BC940DRAFT_258943 [Gongronella butleri]|nr:hypothetical protein BC940DRAFT_258943 [Gongronella butleri]
MTHQYAQKPRKCIGDYYVGKTLGKGASGRVKLGVHKHTGEQVAIKIISKAHLAANPAIEKAVRREIAIMKLIRHPNVMSLVDVIDDANSSEVYLILEYVQGGELFEYLVSRGRLSDSEARRHFQQIILGLDYCHHHLICHRDLKPENLLLDNQNNIKIADFGMASLQPMGSMLETSCGSPHYASPEIVAGMPYNGSASDIWSCGVILYALLTGHLPFDDENIRQLLKKVKAGKYTMPNDISKTAQDLIRRILVVDPSKRLTMKQIMMHPWFCESEPANLHTLPVPPTANEIGRPVWDASEIDDRLLETIKFLWGERSDDVVIQALVSKEHNMQKVVYVLLQQHAEQYWQNDHDDENDDADDSGDSGQKYRTIGRNTVRARRCRSMVDSTAARNKASANGGNGRLALPWGPDGQPADRTVPAPPMLPTPSPQRRRYSAATTNASHPHHHGHHATQYHCTQQRMTSAIMERPIPDLMQPPPLPPVSPSQKSAIKKSDTFVRFFKNVLSSRRQSKAMDNDAPSAAGQAAVAAAATTATSPSSMSARSAGSSKPNSPISPVSGNSSHPYATLRSTLAGTLRRKNPFAKMVAQQQELADMDNADVDASPSSPTMRPTVPEKSTLRRLSMIRNKIDPSAAARAAAAANADANAANDAPENDHSSPSSPQKGFNTRRLSVRVPNVLRNDNGTRRFSLTVAANRRQRKELDMSIFQPFHGDASLTPPPVLSNGSSLSCSSSSSGSNGSNGNVHGKKQANVPTSSSSSSSSSTNTLATPAANTTTTTGAQTTTASANGQQEQKQLQKVSSQQASQFKMALKSMPGKGEFLHSPPPQAQQQPRRRESQASILSVDRRGSNISVFNTRPITPSLLSNSSTITTSSSTAPPSPVDDNNNGKASWLNQLFFFKQPKICSLVIPEQDAGVILYTLHRWINKTAEAKFYEKEDKHGLKRYKAEIKVHHQGKVRQVKCRLEILPVHDSPSSRVVRFTQQQGDAVVLASVIRQLHFQLNQDYPSLIASNITADF